MHAVVMQRTMIVNCCVDQKLSVYMLKGEGTVAQRHSSAPETNIVQVPMLVKGP